MRGDTFGCSGTPRVWIDGVCVEGRNGGWRVNGERQRCTRCGWRRPAQQGLCSPCFRDVCRGTVTEREQRRRSWWRRG